MLTDVPSGSFDLLPLLAAGPGAGGYFSPIKLALIVGVYFLWIKCCSWVDRDAERLELSRSIWNALVITSGLFGGVVYLLFPIFGFALFIHLTLVLTPTLAYTFQRNQHVPAQLRWLTPAHLQRIWRRLKSGVAASPERRVAVGDERRAGPRSSAPASSRPRPSATSASASAAAAGPRSSGPRSSGPASRKPTRRAVPDDFDDDDETYQLADEAMDQADDEETAAHHDILAIRFIGKGEKEEDAEQRIARAQSSPSYRGAAELILDALNARATDIHMEPTRDEMAIRFRIDSIMQPQNPFRKQRGEAVLNVFKVLAGLDITEKRKSQDGSFSAILDNREIDFRVATTGSVSGEKMVMRILDRSRQVTGLADLGMRDTLRSQLRSIIHQPHGMLIVCGPTGSGKSSTLYACLAEIDRSQRNVITLENPVEYQLDMVTQIEINERAGKTFASELRSILRQDPDVILVGEIRDAETAEIACQAAQTGHMVYTTLHANDAVTALSRLIDLGVAPFLIASSLSAVLAQRLVRVLCPRCKIRYRPTAEQLSAFRLSPEKVKELYRAATPEDRTDEQGRHRVCSHCNGVGYRGRTGIFELLVINDEIRALIREKPDLLALKQAALKHGLSTLSEDALRKVLEGRTSLEELNRVVK